MYSYSVNGIVMILMATHVDDVIWASEPEFETIVQEMQRVLHFGRVHVPFLWPRYEAGLRDVRSEDCLLEHFGEVREQARLSKAASQQSLSLIHI